MAFRNNVPQASWRLAKIALGGVVLAGLAVLEPMSMLSQNLCKLSIKLNWTDI